MRRVRLLLLAADKVVYQLWRLSVKEIPLNDEITWHRPLRPGYSEMRGPGAGYCVAFVVLPVVLIVLAILIGVI